MKIVIDIDDEVYNEIKNKGQGKWYCREMDNAIRQGTPLPKGHKRLIDTSDLCLAIAARMFNIEVTNSIPIKDLQDVIDNETITIVEADKEKK